MRSAFQPVRLATVPLLGALVVFGLLWAEPAVAAKRRPPPAPPPGFAVDMARFEPITSGQGVVRLDGVGEYRGALELRRGPAGIGAVNDVSLEEYLKGIAEMPSGWPAEALRAQAIAARTYALWVLQARPAGEAAGLGAQICATESCQVYSGTAKESAPRGDAWAAAVDATRGQVLLYQGKPILAKYSSSNGGRSVSGGRPYLKVVDDPDDAKSPLHRWELTVSYDDLGRALAAPGPVRTLRAEGGEVVAEWTGADGGAGRMAVPRSDFRAKVNAALPPPAGRSRTVPSVLFSLAADDDARMASLDGRGYGHGIGLSQYGAYGKALRGVKAPAILAAYYGGLKPTTLPAGKLPPSVRVAVDPGRSEALVGASGPFRVLDGRGKVVAAVASGAWRVVPGARTGLRLVPPPGQAGDPRLQVMGIDPPSPGVGQVVVVRFRSTMPALVAVTAHPPGGTETQVVAPRPVGSETVSASLPAATGPGAYVVAITADAGGGRTDSLPLAPQVSAPLIPGGTPSDLPGPGGTPPGPQMEAAAVVGEKWAPPGSTPPAEQPPALQAALASVERGVRARASRSRALHALSAAEARAPATTDGQGAATGTVLVAGGLVCWRWRHRRRGAQTLQHGP
jgi:stage II sporulation protein D